MSKFDAATRGVIAGFLATGPMTVFMDYFFKELPHKERYPLPPREITEKTVPALQNSASRQTRFDLTLLGHFAYGAVAGMICSLVKPRVRSVWKTGLVYGAAVWGASYPGWLPSLSVLKPVRKQPKNRTILMIAAHGVWGVTAAYFSRRLLRTELTSLGVERAHKDAA